MTDILSNNIQNVFWFYDENEPNNGLYVLFEFSESYLFFNTISFYITPNNDITRLYKWEKLDYDKLHTGVSITKLREDECTAYFAELSNGDIFYISQLIYGYGDWTMQCEFVDKNDSERYEYVFEHMNEGWIEDIEPQVSMHPPARS